MNEFPPKGSQQRLQLRQPALTRDLPVDAGGIRHEQDFTDLDLLERWLLRDTLDDLCMLAYEDLRGRCGISQILLVEQSDGRSQRWAAAPREEALVREVDSLFASPSDHISSLIAESDVLDQVACAGILNSRQRLRELGFHSSAHVATDRPVDFCVFWGGDPLPQTGSNVPGSARPEFTARSEWRVLVAVLRNLARMEHLRAISHIDSVTGILNRHYFNKRLVEEVARARRFKRPLALAVFDIDHFKSLNDTFGHQQGDIILRKMAEYVRWTIRSIDVFCRLGGDEFAVLMPDANLDDCAHFADRLLSVLSGQRFALDGAVEEVALAVSIGAAVFPNHAEKHERLLWCADMALLEAKQQGRGRYLLFEEPYGHHVVG